MNQELREIFEADQKDRANKGLHADYVERDRARRRRVQELAAAGELTTGEEYAMAAIVCQHGDTPDDYWQAHLLAQKAVELGETGISWLVAAGLDRHLVRQGKPARYGTQTVRMAGIYRVPRLDPATTDEERAALGIPPLAAILAQDRSPGRPPVTLVGSLEVPGLQVNVLSLPRPLTWHCEMLPDREATGLSTTSGLPVWRNVQGWHWTETPEGELALGWYDLPWAPVIGHMEAQIPSAELLAGDGGIWVRADGPYWTFYNAKGERVWAVTGLSRSEIRQQMEQLM
ncbi:MAG TPA: hypothetical protein VNT75_01885 [Symbiobacteriaceae bacterium]|nr:hypothetical protein [Symbiobacteriaceae bacterium]